jgi:CW_7 repeat
MVILRHIRKSRLLDNLATPRFGKRKEEQKMSDETTPVETNDDSVPDVAPEESQDETSAFEAPSTEATVEKTIDELAVEVLEGKWGVGQDRRLRLSRAGYDRHAVQARVNQLIAERRA